MKIVVIGDIHGDFPKLFEILDNTDADLYLQVGDLAGFMDFNTWVYTEVSKPLIFIAGNHENYDILEPYNSKDRKEMYEIEKNLFYLPIGHHVNIKGVRIGGLGGNYAPTRYHLNRKELHYKRRRHYTQNDVNKLLTSKKLDILLTHEAPSPFIIHRYPHTPKDIGKGSDIGRPEITYLIKSLKPRYHFYGHHHFPHTQILHDCKCVCVPIFNYVSLDLCK